MVYILAEDFALFIGISKCLRRKQWVDETPFEVVGTNEAKVEAPRRARQNAAKQVSTLPSPPKAGQVRLVYSGGGFVVVT